MPADPSENRGRNASARPEATRLIVVASSPVALGFGLLGIETVADATPEQLERLLDDLVAHQESALLFVEEKLARGEGTWLRYVRDESSNIVLVEIPQLHGAREHESALEALIRKALGRSSGKAHADGG